MVGPGQQAIRIPVEIDNAKAVASAKQTGDAWVDQGKRTDAAVKRTGDTVAKTARTMAAGIGAATAAVAAHERQWLTAASSVVATFAAAGPVAGAVAGVAALIGFLSSNFSDATEAIDQQVRRISEGSTTVSSELASLRAEFRSLLGESKVDQEINDANKALGRLGGALAEVEAGLKKVRSSSEAKARVGRSGSLLSTLGDFFSIDALTPTARIDGERLTESELEELREKLKSEQQRLREARTDAIGRKDTGAGVAEQKEAKRVRELNDELKELVKVRESLRGATEFRRFRSEIEAQAQDLADKGADADLVRRLKAAQITDFFDAQKQSLLELADLEADRLRLAKEVDPFERERLRLARDTEDVLSRLTVPESAPEEVKRLNEELRKTVQLTSTISGAFIEGIQRGSDGAEEVLKNFLGSISSTLLNLGIGAGLNALSDGGLFSQGFQGFFAKGFAEGGSFVTSGGPALFATSERGGAPELVQTDRHQTTITPVEDLGTGSGGVTINGGVSIRVDGSQSPRDTARAVREEIMRLQRSGRGRRTLGR